MCGSPLVVLKFGGSVLTDESTLRLAVHEIYRWRRRNYRVVAVVSALAGVTDESLQEVPSDRRAAVAGERCGGRVERRIAERGAVGVALGPGRRAGGGARAGGVRTGGRRAGLGRHAGRSADLAAAAGPGPRRRGRGPRLRCPGRRRPALRARSRRFRPDGALFGPPSEGRALPADQGRARPLRARPEPAWPAAAALCGGLVERCAGNRRVDRAAQGSAICRRNMPSSSSWADSTAASRRGLAAVPPRFTPAASRADGSAPCCWAAARSAAASTTCSANLSRWSRLCGWPCATPRSIARKACRPRFLRPTRWRRRPKASIW